MEIPLSEARLHALDYLQIIRNRFSIILLTFSLIFITAVAITHIMPEEYLGRATVEIVQNDEDLKLFAGAAGMEMAGLQFIQTQFEVISSQQTLYRVIDELDLVNRWNTGTRQAAFGVLAGKLETSARRNTSLIDIEIYADSPEEAAELANAVSESYAERRRMDDQARIDKALGALDSELEKQRARVADQRAEMLRLMRENNIIDLAQGSSMSTGEGGEPVTSTPGVLMSSEHHLHTLKGEIEQLRTQIEKLGELSGDELFKMAMSLDVADASVTQVYPQFLDQSIELERLRNLGLGARHPKVTALEKGLTQMRSFLEAGVQTIQENLDTRLRIATDSLVRIEKLHDEKKDESMAEREDYVAYAEAKNEYHRQNGLLQSMEANSHQVAIEKNMTSTPIRIHQHAEANPVPAKPNVLLNLILGGIVGLGTGFALAFFIEYLDTSVKSLEDVERLMETPVLGVIPKDIGLLVHQGENSPDAEAYRILRTNIEFNRTDPEANVITVVSGSAGEGKSTTLANLAYVCSQGGYTTLIIDGDLRRPQLHQFFGAANEKGLSNYLVGQCRLEEVVLRTREENLWFLPSGTLPKDPAGLLNSQNMVDFVADMKSRFDIVLIDSPPILGVSDSAVLAREADLTMVVVQHRKLPQKTLVRVKQAIVNAGGTVLGVVLNNVDVRSDSQYQYYTSYYTYYSTPQGPGHHAPAVAAAAKSALSKPAERPAQPAAPVQEQIAAAAQAQPTAPSRNAAAPQQAGPNPQPGGGSPANARRKLF